MAILRVVHEAAAARQLELVNERLAGIDVRLRQAADAVHAVRHRYAVPVHGGMLGQLVGDEDADLVALHCFDGRPGRLAVVSPKIGLHARRELAHHQLGDEMELLPVAIHPTRERPAVEGNHRPIVRAARRKQWRLHGVGPGGRRLGNACGLDASADGADARQQGARVEKVSS
jgi:hypothetical protein